MYIFIYFLEETTKKVVPTTTPEPTEPAATGIFDFFKKQSFEQFYTLQPRLTIHTLYNIQFQDTRGKIKDVLIMNMVITAHWKVQYRNVILTASVGEFLTLGAMVESSLYVPLRVLRILLLLPAFTSNPVINLPLY